MWGAPVSKRELNRLGCGSGEARRAAQACGKELHPQVYAVQRERGTAHHAPRNRRRAGRQGQADSTLRGTRPAGPAWSGGTARWAENHPSRLPRAASGAALPMPAAPGRKETVPSLAQRNWVTLMSRARSRRPRPGDCSLHGEKPRRPDPATLSLAPAPPHTPKQPPGRGR